MVLREQGTILDASATEDGLPIIIVGFSSGRQLEFVLDEKTLGSVPHLGDIVTVIYEPTEAPAIRGIRVDGIDEEIAADGSLRALQRIAEEYDGLDWAELVSNQFSAMHERGIDLSRAGSDLRFQVCLGLYSRGYPRTPHEPHSVIQSLLYRNFEPDAYLFQEDTPGAVGGPGREWNTMYCVHRRFLESQLMQGEKVLCIDDGILEFGARTRGGTISVTSQRLVAIGMYGLYLTRPDESWFDIMYPSDSWFGTLIHVGPSHPPTPYGSLDYLPLSRLKEAKVNLGRRSKTIELVFKNVRIARCRIKEPSGVTVFPGVHVQLSSRQLKIKPHTGDARVVLRPGHLLHGRQDKSDLKIRLQSLRDAILDASSSADDIWGSFPE